MVLREPDGSDRNSWAVWYQNHLQRDSGGRDQKHPLPYEGVTQHSCNGGPFIKVPLH